MAQQLTDKQRLYLEARTLRKMTRAEAKAYAGYAESKAPSEIEKSPALRNALDSALEKVGVTPDFIAQKMREGMEAEQVTFGVYRGEFKEVKRTPDMAVRRQYLRDGMEVKGYVRVQGGDVHVSLGVIALPAMADENSWNRRSEAELMEPSPDLSDSATTGATSGPASPSDQ